MCYPGGGGGVGGWWVGGWGGGGGGVTIQVYEDRMCEGKGCLPTNSNSVQKGVILNLLR